MNAEKLAGLFLIIAGIPFLIGSIRNGNKIGIFGFSAAILIGLALLIS